MTADVLLALPDDVDVLPPPDDPHGTGLVLRAVQRAATEHADRPAAGIAVALTPLPAPPEEGALAALYALARHRTSLAGTVTVLDLPAGCAVATADWAVLETAEGDAPLALAQVFLPLGPTLLTLTVSTPLAADLGPAVELAGALAARIRLDGPEVPGLRFLG